MRDRLALLVLGMFLVVCRGQELPTSPTSPTAAANAVGIPPLTPGTRIESVTPSIGRPEGGEIVRITGDNFEAPVRVFFEADGKRIEAFTVSVQPRMIEVVTPPILLENTQRLAVTVQVIAHAGSEREMKATAKDAFLYQKAALVPVVLVVAPNQAPVTGGQRVTIFGEGFDQPVQVLVVQDGEPRECRVINVRFNEIVVEVPTARRGGLADVIVRNIHSQAESRLANALQYVSALQVSSISPAYGPATGGTIVRISGTGFIGPVVVTIGGVPATVLTVSSTDIVARTNAAGCNDDGPVSVINLVTGDTAAGASFEYRCPRRRAA